MPDTDQGYFIMRKNIYLFVIATMLFVIMPVCASAASMVNQPSVSFASAGHKINNYKYICIENQGNAYGLEERYRDFFTEIGFTVLTEDEAEELSATEREKLLMVNYTCTVVAGAASSQTLTMRNTANKIVYSRSESAYTMTANSDMKRAAKKIMKAVRALEYKYEGE